MIPDIKKMISSSKNKQIKFKVVDVAKDLGDDFIDKNPNTIYWGLKFVLFKEGIVVDMSTRSGEKFLLMRNATKGDELPPSLAKFLESDNSRKDNMTKKKISSKELKNMLDDLPNSLSDTLNVYYHVLGGIERGDATNMVAEYRGVSSGTVMSGYSRSLGKSTSEIDILMQPENSEKFKKFLVSQFPDNVDTINEFFNRT